MPQPSGFRFIARSCQCRALPFRSPQAVRRRSDFKKVPSPNRDVPKDPIIPIPGSARALQDVRDPSLPPQESTGGERGMMDLLEEVIASHAASNPPQMDEENQFFVEGADPEEADMPVRRSRHRHSKIHFGDLTKYLRESQRPPEGLMTLGVDEKEDLLDARDEDAEEEDISAIAQTELEQHREFREYARIAAWEMPLLARMAKPFRPPNKDQILRFRYTTYMGEDHPAQKKVVVEFSPADVPNLTQKQQDKLKKLVGSRWNPEKEIIKMSCEMFESSAQNKRYLGDVVDELVKEAKDPTDTFEDIPLDTRHHPIKVKPKFPVAWRMTEERKALLAAEREKAKLLTNTREKEGAVIDGVKQIQDIQGAIERLKAERAQAEPVLAMAGLKGKRGKTLAVRR